MLKTKNGKVELLFEFEKLNVYQKAVDLSDIIFRITKDKPKYWQYSLLNQINRSALSIALNIAEGIGSHYNNQKKRYLRIARGSVFECLPALDIMLRHELIDNDEYECLYRETFEISSMISGLIKSVDVKKRSFITKFNSVIASFLLYLTK